MVEVTRFYFLFICLKFYSVFAFYFLRMSESNKKNRNRALSPRLCFSVFALLALSLFVLQLLGTSAAAENAGFIAPKTHVKRAGMRSPRCSRAVIIFYLGRRRRSVSFANALHSLIASKGLCAAK